MKRLNVILLTTAGLLSACSLTPEQKAQREASQIRAEQALQIKLAKQCDAETATLMAEHYHTAYQRSPAEQKAFEQRYTEKVNNPMFQACYKMAQQHYKMQEELHYMRATYEDYRFGRFCYWCW